MEKSIDIFLVDDSKEYNGNVISYVDSEVLYRLKELVNEGKRLSAAVEKLAYKKNIILQRSQKFMKKVVSNHNVVYNKDTQAVGISKKDVIYVGPKEDVKTQPDADPKDGDIIIGNIAKHERRKYDDLLTSFKFINEKILIHNQKALLHEAELISFEHSVLKEKDIEYDKEKQMLVVDMKGKVVLCDKENTQ